MSLFKSYAQGEAKSGFTIKVAYSDVAGAYAGWFLARVNGQNIPGADDDNNPNDGPDQMGDISSAGLASGDGEAAPVGSQRARMGGSLNLQVNSRLNAMFGVGHSAKWTATIVQEVTPAVINDDWGTP